MGVIINNSVINAGETPAMFYDPALSNGIAGSFAIGTIALDGSTQSIFRNELVLGENAWVSYSGGGGAQNLQSVLDIGNTGLDISIILNQGGNNNSTTYQNNGINFYSGINDIAFQLFGDFNDNYIYTNFDGTTKGLLFDPITNGFYGVGYNFSPIDKSAKGLAIDSTNGNYPIIAIGDNDFTISPGHNTVFYIDDVNRQIFTSGGNNNLGLFINYPDQSYWLGDFDAVAGNTYIKIDDGNNNIVLNYEGFLNLTGPNITSATSGGSSGDHLIIYCNGTQYKIALLNP